MTHIFAVWHWPAIGLRAVVVAASIALGEMLIVLVLRAHYTLDVVAGALAAFFAAAVAGRLSPALDAWLR